MTTCKTDSSHGEAKANGLCAKCYTADLKARKETGELLKKGRRIKPGSNTEAHLLAKQRKEAIEEARRQLQMIMSGQEHVSVKQLQEIIIILNS